MGAEQTAEHVLRAVGGRTNVSANDVCMTRLRLTVHDPALIKTDDLMNTQGVLGFVQRNANTVDVVFGPGRVQEVHQALGILSHAQGSDESPVCREEAKPSEEATNVEELLTMLADTSDTDILDEEDSEEFDLDDLDDLNDLDDLDDELVPASNADATHRVLVLNGPNINMLGIREPELYGHATYESLVELCHKAAHEAGFTECSCFQTNHEGELVDAIQGALGAYAGIVINPAAYTHTSIAILDAAKAVGLPMVEVHISHVEKREDYRQISYIREACFATISGQGIEGYRSALQLLAEHLELKQS